MKGWVYSDGWAVPQNSIKLVACSTEFKAAQVSEQRSGMTLSVRLQQREEERFTAESRWVLKIQGFNAWHKELLKKESANTIEQRMNDLMQLARHTWLDGWQRVDEEQGLDLDALAAKVADVLEKKVAQQRTQGMLAEKGAAVQGKSNELEAALFEDFDDADDWDDDGWDDGLSEEQAKKPASGRHRSPVRVRDGQGEQKNNVQWVSLSWDDFKSSWGSAVLVVPKAGIGGVKVGDIVYENGPEKGVKVPVGAPVGVMAQGDWIRYFVPFKKGQSYSVAQVRQWMLQHLQSGYEGSSMARWTRESIQEGLQNRLINNPTDEGAQTISNAPEQTVTQKEQGNHEVPPMRRRVVL